MLVQEHQVVMANRRYPKGLRFFECRDCDYAFMAEVQPNNMPDLRTRVRINSGDPQATHSLFFAPKIELSFSVDASVADAPGDGHDCEE